MTDVRNGLKKAINTILKAANVIAVAFLCIVLVFNLYSVIVKLVTKNSMPKVLGYTNAIIVSPSMSGAIEVNDMIIMREQSSYSLGDIITYKEGKSYITHRIMYIENGKYITKGDANDTADPPIDPSQVVGKVIFIIPEIGAAINFLRTPIGILLILFVGAALIYLPLFIDNLRKNKTAGKE